MTVSGVRVNPGDCQNGQDAFGQECRTVTVHVDNTNGTSELHLGAGHWTATTGDDHIVQLGQVSPATVGKGVVGTLKVAYTVQAAWAPLATVAYDDPVAYGETPVPPPPAAGPT